MTSPRSYPSASRVHCSSCMCLLSPGRNAQVIYGTGLLWPQLVASTCQKRRPSTGTPTFLGPGPVMGRSPCHARMVRRCSRPSPNGDAVLGTGRGGKVCPSGFEAFHCRWQASGDNTVHYSGQGYQRRIWASPGSLR
jgi:hypothetical protein